MQNKSTEIAKIEDLKLLKTPSETALENVDVYDLNLEYSPRKWQNRCHSLNIRFKVIALHRQGGKTEFSIMALVDAAIECTKTLAVFAYVAPYRTQAKVVTWARLKHKIRHLIDRQAVECNETELTITFLHNGVVIRLFGADNADAIRGVTLYGVVMDEVANIRSDVWEKIIRPMLVTTNGWGVFIGTPDGVNLFSELYFQAKKQDDWVPILYTVYETDALPAEEIAKLRSEMSEEAFAREFLCDFNAHGTNQLISLSNVMVSSQIKYREDEFSDAPVILGVDPARFGDDRTVIFRRSGVQSFEPIVLKGADNMEVASRVAGEINQHKPDATFIDSGAGAGVIDRLVQLGYDIIEVPFGGRALNADKFVNRRSEMWFKMKNWVCLRGSIPNNMTLKKELSTPIYWYDPKGRIALEPKDEIKKRLNSGSPDLADALALTFAEDVYNKNLHVKNYYKPDKKSVKEYDPFEKFNKEYFES